MFDESLPILANIHLNLMVSNILKQYELGLISKEEHKDKMEKITIARECVTT